MAARSFQPPHAVFGRRADDVQFDREVRKLPPFALFGGMSEHQGPAEDENMWREERKMPPFSVFNRPRYTGFQRDSRLVPPFAVFSDKQQAHSEHGKRQQEDFPLA